MQVRLCPLGSRRRAACLRETVPDGFSADVFSLLHLIDNCPPNIRREIRVIVYPEIISITRSPVMALKGSHTSPHKTQC